MNDVLLEIIDTLKELKRMHQLNYELLEQLNIACGFLRKNHISLPNEEKIVILLSKAMSLLAEIQAKTPIMLQYQKIGRRKVTDYRADGEVTEPTEGVGLCSHKAGKSQESHQETCQHLGH